MASGRSALPADLVARLERCGLSWALEKGSKHDKLKIAGRLVVALPRTRWETSRRRQQNAEKAVARAIRELGGVIRD